MYEGMNLLWRIIGVVLIFVVMWIVTNAMLSIDSGAAAYFLVNAVFWAAVLSAAILLLFPPEQAGLRKGLIAVSIIVMLVLSVRAAYAVREPVGFKALNRGENGFLLKIGNWLTDPFYSNNQATTNAYMTCEEKVAANYADDEKYSLASFNSGQLGDGYDTAESYYQHLREKNEEKRQAGLRACTLQPKPSVQPVTNTVTTPPVTQPRITKRAKQPRKRTFAKKCRIICKEG